MSEQPNHPVRLCLPALVMAILTMLAQAGVAAAQSNANVPADDLPPRLSEPPFCPDANAMASNGSAAPWVAGLADPTMAAGGLWLSGNTAGGLAYLHWIAGYQQAGLLKLDREGKVSLDASILAKAAGITSLSAAEQRARIASLLRADEGLRLLAQLTRGAFRILLYVGPAAPTRAGDSGPFGLLNLDDRYDSRINPLRRNGQKLDKELPPRGFNSLVAINPEVCWFNLENRRLMPLAQMTFHELAEAHARQVLGLDYLPQSDQPGAHDVALEREIRLKQERPAQVVLMPVGLNQRLMSRDDWLRLFAKLANERTTAPKRSESQNRSLPHSSLQRQ